MDKKYSFIQSNSPWKAQSCFFFYFSQHFSHKLSNVITVLFVGEHFSAVAEFLTMKGSADELASQSVI